MNEQEELKCVANIIHYYGQGEEHQRDHRRDVALIEPTFHQDF